jgi:ABC-2 type transport system ATP-binding protein
LTLHNDLRTGEAPGSQLPPPAAAPAPADAVVSVRGLVKSYGPVPAVRGLDLDVRAGEVLALLGPNGAGKTSTVEIMAGLRGRDGGSVTVLGVDPDRGDRAWRARLGIVAQLSAPGAELTIRELVRYFAAFYPDPRDPDEVIELVGLTEKARSRSNRLSGGQVRRLDVALGIIGGPELLFLDEPTTGFDPEARRQFWELVRRLAGDGTTIVMTTHYLEEAEALADRIAVICGGRIIADGDPATLGGRDLGRCRVAWTAPEGRVLVETDTPATLVAELVATAGGEVPGLTVTRPTLEDAYLKLIGATE